MQYLSTQFSKETRFARWRAYAKGCLDLCDRYSKKAMQERSKLNDVAPKDVKQLEVLKPITTPSMGERYKQSIEKEKRLEAATRPVQKATKSQERETEDPEEKKGKKKTKKKKKPVSASAMATDDALDQQDEVEEGINWSDEDE